MSTVWLFLHVVSMMLAFGPTFAFPMISAMARKDPKHAPFVSTVGVMLTTRMTRPFAILTGVTGVLLIIQSDLPISGTLWLEAGIGIYLVALAFANFYQLPNARKMAAIMQAMGEAGGAPDGSPAGPPPEVIALGKKLQIGGMVLGIATLVIIYLMVAKPIG